MCTVSYIPLSQSEFLLTSNRDEGKERGLASAPAKLKLSHYEIVAPVDPFAKGSWIAASSRGDVVCLLNGAFKKHQHRPPYRMSRGQVVMDYFNHHHPVDFGNEYLLEGIEPFTLIMIHPAAEIELYELRWDGRERFLKKLKEREFHLWSSCTLYTPELEVKKRDAFAKGLKQIGNINAGSVTALHRNFLYEEWVLPPQRVPQVSTLSITSVNSGNNMLEMNYKDLSHHSEAEQLISLPVTREKVNKG